MTKASKKVPVSIEENVVAISGGSLKGKVHAAWIARVHEIDTKKFVTADRLDCRFAKYVDSNFKMLDFVIDIRNKVVEDAMRATCSADDPMQDDDAAPLPKRPRKEMFDDIPKIIEIKVQRVGKPELTLKVLSCWYTRNKLAFELKAENVELFMESPPQASELAPGSEMRSYIKQPNVKWNRSRHAVQCSYFCKEKLCWRLKVMKVERCDNVAYAVESMATLCQQFYNTHHKDEDGDEHGDDREAGEEAAVSEVVHDFSLH